MMATVTKYEDEESLKEAEELRNRVTDMLAAMGHSAAGNKESKWSLIVTPKEWTEGDVQQYPRSYGKP